MTFTITRIEKGEKPDIATMQVLPRYLSRVRSVNNKYSRPVEWVTTVRIDGKRLVLFKFEDGGMKLVEAAR